MTLDHSPETDIFLRGPAEDVHLSPYLMTKGCEVVSDTAQVTDNIQHNIRMGSELLVWKSYGSDYMDTDLV
jgi:hypothetical protein